KDGIETIRARTSKQAAWMLEHYAQNLPHHLLFSTDTYGGGSHSGYYIGDVEYTPEREATRVDRRIPPHCDLDLWHIENDARVMSRITLRDEDCRGFTCVEMLAKQGYVPETTRLLAKLKDETERYYTKRVKIGTQHTATGFGLCDLDDRLTDKESSSWRSSTIKMDHFGIARVVVDILYEREEEEERRSRGSNAHIDAY